MLFWGFQCCFRMSVLFKGFQYCFRGFSVVLGGLVLF